jgi:toxin ParE1/3/4
MRVVWTRPALSHLEQIGDYIGRDNPSAAHRVVHDIHDRTSALLSRNPMIGRSGRDPETRELVFSGTRYIVAYRIRAEQIEILAVIHSSRRWPDKL